MARQFHKVSRAQWYADKTKGAKDINWLNLYDLIILPERKTLLSAGYDFHSPYEFTLSPGEAIIIQTGVKIELQSHLMMNIYPRSGMGFKYFTRLANSVGIIDADYYNNPQNEGHIFIKMRNEGNEKVTIGRGEAFAQGIISNYYLVDGDSFTKGNTRAGGVGSTNKGEK